MPDDSLSAALAEIRANHEAANAFGANSGDPVPRLLALADALLELCTDWDGRAREIMAQVTDEDLFGATAGFKAIGASGYEGRAKEVREVISRELLGEGQT